MPCAPAVTYLRPSASGRSHDLPLTVVKTVAAWHPPDMRLCAAATLAASSRTILLEVQCSRAVLETQRGRSSRPAGVLSTHRTTEAIPAARGDDAASQVRSRAFRVGSALAAAAPAAASAAVIAATSAHAAHGTRARDPFPFAFAGAAATSPPRPSRSSPPSREEGDVCDEEEATLWRDGAAW